MAHKIYYLVVDTTIAAGNLKKIKDEAIAEFKNTRPGNELSVEPNPLYNEAYIKIVTDEVSPYVKQKVQQAIDLGWVKSMYTSNESFRTRLQEYWATIDTGT